MLDLARRLYYLEAFQAELDEATRGKEFLIQNDVLWLILLDSRDMLVVHLASWAKAIYTNGGLIGQLQASHAKSFSRRRTWVDKYEADDEALKQFHDESHTAAFKRLFSSDSEPFPKPIAFNTLRDNFARRMEPVVQDRSSNRAHPYEAVQKKANAKMLSLGELRGVVGYAEELMNDLQLVGCGSTLQYADMNFSNSKDTAIEFVDAIVLGTLMCQQLAREATRRESLYERLHSRHDVRLDASAVAFNEFAEVD
ncbi:MAG: hypothetical protein ACM34E_01495 [Acidobacteriota bacterium]